MGNRQRILLVKIKVEIKKKVQYADDDITK